MFLFEPMPSKVAAEKKNYSFIWKEELQQDNDTIASGASSSNWDVTPAGVTINTSDKPKSHDDYSATVWLDPGSTPGDYTVKNTITTAQGKILVGVATLKVVA